jgi:hypothetical protein
LILFFLTEDEAKPSIEVDIKIASTLEVTIDYLVGKTTFELDYNTMNRLQDIKKLVQDDTAHIFALLDAFIQSQKAKRVFS